MTLLEVCSLGQLPDARQRTHVLPIQAPLIAVERLVLHFPHYVQTLCQGLKSKESKREKPQRGETNRHTVVRSPCNQTVLIRIPTLLQAHQTYSVWGLFFVHLSRGGLVWYRTVLFLAVVFICFCCGMLQCALRRGAPRVPAGAGGVCVVVRLSPTALRIGLRWLRGSGDDPAGCA